MTAIEIIRTIGTEFSSVSDDEVNKWIEIVCPMVSKKHFGRLFEQGLAYLVCHKMKMAGLGVNPLGGPLGTVGLGLSVSSVSEGGSSVSFGANQSSSLTKDAELAMTVYGVQFLTLRRSVIVPIHCSGESE